MSDAGVTEDRYLNTLSGSSRNWMVQAILAALVSQLLSFVLYSYPFWMSPNNRWLFSYQPLCQNPWITDAIREPQVRHRILAPLIAHYVGLRGMEGAAVPIVANTLTLIVWYLMLRGFLKASDAFWGTILLSTTLAIISSQTWLGYPDSLGNFAITLCLFTRRWWTITPLLFLGLLAEERCAACFPLVLLWHLSACKPGCYKHFFLRGMAGAAAVGSWLFLYLFVFNQFVVPTPDIPTPNFFKGGPATFGLASLKENLNALPEGVYQALRTAWIFPVWLGYLWFRKHPLKLAILLIAIIISIVPSLLVGDISRSASLAFPAIAIALRETHKLKPEHFGIILKLSVLLNIFSPQYQVVGQMFQLYWPLPFSLFRAWKGI